MPRNFALNKTLLLNSAEQKFQVLGSRMAQDNLKWEITEPPIIEILNQQFGHQPRWFFQLDLRNFSSDPNGFIYLRPQDRMIGPYMIPITLLPLLYTKLKKDSGVVNAIKTIEVTPEMDDSSLPANNQEDNLREEAFLLWLLKQTQWHRRLFHDVVVNVSPYEAWRMVDIVPGYQMTAKDKQREAVLLFYLLRMLQKKPIDELAISDLNSDFNEPLISQHLKTIAKLILFPSLIALSVALVLPYAPSTVWMIPVLFFVGMSLAIADVVACCLLLSIKRDSHERLMGFYEIGKEQAMLRPPVLQEKDMPRLRENMIGKLYWRGPQQSKNFVKLPPHIKKEVDNSSFQHLLSALILRDRITAAASMLLMIFHLVMIDQGFCAGIVGHTLFGLDHSMAATGAELGISAGLGSLVLSAMWQYQHRHRPGHDCVA